MNLLLLVFYLLRCSASAIAVQRALASAPRLASPRLLPDALLATLWAIKWTVHAHSPGQNM